MVFKHAQIFNIALNKVDFIGAISFDNDKRFKILAVARNSFHLCLLEATFIKTRHPVLCKQKEFVYTLKLFK